MSEKQVIECLLHDNASYDTLALVPEDFTDREHRAVYLELSKLIEKGVDVNVVTLFESEGLNASLLASYEPFTAANAEFYADEIKEATRLRQLNRVSMMIQDQIKEKKTSDEIITGVDQAIFSIAERKSNEVKMVKEYVMTAMDELEAAFHNKTALNGIPTGYDIDEKLNGLENGELIVIAARTSIGKTALALNMAEKMALEDYVVGFFSCEMAASYMVKRLLASMGKVDHQTMRTALLTPADFSKLGDAAGKIYDTRFYLDDTPNIHYEELHAKARMMKRRGVQIIFVDYLTLVQYGEPKAPAHERVGELTVKLKTMARELEIPVVVLSQLNRLAEGKEPSLSELRASGGIEEHADTIMFLHRERDSCDTKLTIAKHRNGPTGSTELYFNEKYTRFENKVQHELNYSNE